MVISTEILTWYFIIYATVYNSLAIGIYIASRIIRRRSDLDESPPPRKYPVDHISIIIPARDEALVIKDTITSMRYGVERAFPGVTQEILVVDDASEDDTWEVLKQFSELYPNEFIAERRLPPDCHQGKAEALNVGLKRVQKRYEDRDLNRWVIGVFDADAFCEPSLFTSVIEMFETQHLDAVQCGVRIVNAAAGWLPLFQDVEFLSFSGLLQKTRNISTGSSMLGGNAQFVRASAIERVRVENGTVWNPEAQTEDLDLGMRLHCSGGRVAYCDESVVQQGLASVRTLLRQRTRWAWGTIQTCFWYLPRWKTFWKSPIPWYRKLDIAYYLLFWLMPIAVLFTWILTLLSIVTGLIVVNPFSTLVLLLVSLSYFPLLMAGVYGHYSLSKPRTWLLLGLTILYTYHWVPALSRGLWLFAMRRTPQWFKTERIDPATYTEEPLPDQSN